MRCCCGCIVRYVFVSFGLKVKNSVFCVGNESSDSSVGLWYAWHVLDKRRASMRGNNLPVQKPPNKILVPPNISFYNLEILSKTRRRRKERKFCRLYFSIAASSLTFSPNNQPISLPF